MPTRYSSRYFFRDELGRRYREGRERLAFVEADDNRPHLVRGGDTLASIAALYYAGEPQPGLLWWAIADYQVPPLPDPFVPLRAGLQLQIPSLERVKTYLRARR